jgi:hypothetical protein
MNCQAKKEANICVNSDLWLFLWPHRFVLRDRFAAE